MIDESNININLLGGLGENQIPGLTDNEAIFPGSERPITEFPSNLSSDIGDGEEAVDYSLAILGDSEGAMLPTQPFANADLTGSDEGETLRATRSKSSAEKVDSLTGEVIETSAIETRSGNSDFIKVEEVFNTGYFVADETGEINIDYLHDGTGAQGELAIFSLEDFKTSFLQSEQDFIKEATRRAFSNSELGRVLINDTTEGAYFGGWADKGEYQGVKTFNLTPGDKYAFALVPNGTIKEVLDNPKVGGNKKPLFSLFSEKYDYLPGKQFADVTGNGEILGIESSSVNNPRSDKDYDDVVINIEGLTGTVSPFDEVIKEGKDWREKRLGKQLNDYANFPDISLNSGKFVADASGELKIDYIYDGTGHQGELAIFSLDGLAELNLKSKKDFIEEAASRSLTNSELGRVLIRDKTEGAYLDGWANKGEHQGVKSFNLKPGDEYAFMIVPNGTVKEVLDNPNITGSKQPLFSVFDEDNEDYLSGKQFADVTGNGDVLGIETSPVNNPSSDKDYEDLIVHIEGLTGTGSPFDEVIKEGKDWREKRLGKQIDEYVELSDFDFNSFDSGKFVVDESGELKIDYIYDGTRHQGELAIFNLDGFADLNIKSEKDFIKEATSRALSNSELGYVVVSDKTEGAYLDGWANKGEHQGVKTFNLKPGDEYGLMIVPNGTVKEVFDKPDISGSKKPLFSVSSKASEKYFPGKQFADVTGNGEILGIESSPVNHPRSDKDYEDLIIHIEGARGKVSPFDEVIKPGKDWRNKSLGKKVQEYIDLSALSFDLGEFVVGESGEVTVDFLFDGGGYKSQLAIFSLEDLEAKSYTDFVKQAAERALSNSELGYIAISDAAEGAKFIGELGEKNQNSGEYLGVKTFNMNQGEKFAFMFVPNGSVEDVFNNPKIGGSKHPFFSLVTDNPDDEFRPGQMGDVTGEGVIFAFEDKKVSNEKVDRDYNDFVISVNGVEDASGVAVELDDLINPEKDWRKDELGQELIDSLEENPPLPGPGEINSPQDLFLLKDLLYNPGETLEILGKVSDTDGGGDMARIDFWLQQDGGQWEDIADVTEFEVDGDEARFDYELAGLEAGQYQLKAIAYDLDGNENELVEGFTVLSLAPGEELSDRVIWAIERSMNLDTYDPDALAATREWVVSVKAGESAAELAESFGAQNLGSTGYIPNTYIWKFPADASAEDVAARLESLPEVEFGYPSVPVEAQFWSPSGSGDTLLDQQWHLENTGQTGGTPGADAKVKAAWELGYKGSDVVIGVVDDGFDLTHPDLQPNNLTELNYDFDQKDNDPSEILTASFSFPKAIDILSRSQSTDELDGSEKPQKFSLKVPSLNGDLRDVKVDLDIKDADISDWDVFLISPQGTRTKLFAGESGSGEFTATTSVFKGESPRTHPNNDKYTWVLEIENKTENDDGVLKSWSLDLETIQGHGTQVAGVAAAKGGNGIGVAGVAPEARWAGLRLGADGFLSTEIAGALSWKKDEIDIYSNSWGAGFFVTPRPLAEFSISEGIEEGRDELGNIYVFSAGNDGLGNDDVNYNAFTNSRHSIAVGAIDHNGEQIDYSTPGASLSLSAPSKNIQSFFGLGEEDDFKKIKDGKTITSEINVSDVAGKLTDLVVNLKIDHQRYRDLKVALVSPSGKTVELFADAAFTDIHHQGQSLSRVLDVDASISLSDWAAKEIPTTEETLFMGSYRPKGNLAEFQGLKGNDVNGQWELQITDRAGGGNVGQLNRWSLNMGTGGIVTTAAGGEYAKDFSGTSASAPLVSGAVALMLDANENLSWRDTKQILLETADKNDPDHEDWVTNGAGYHVNHEYGFGAIDVEEAVATALEWKEEGKTLDKEDWISSRTIDVDYEKIGDATEEEFGEEKPGATATSTINFEDLGIDKELSVESAEVHFKASHEYRGDLEIVLVHTYTDPVSGEEKVTESVLAEIRDDEGESYDWWFTSDRHRGELSRGTWELQVTDKWAGYRGIFESWELKLFGTKTNTAPEATNLDQELNYTEETPIALEDIVVTDPDTGDTISVTLELNNPAGGSIASGADESDADGELSFEGTVAEVNSWLAGLEFKPAEDFTDNLEIAVEVTDNHISLPLTGTIALVGKTDNDPPTVANAIADQTATEDVEFELVLPEDTFADVDDDEFEYSASELPEWLTFDAAKGTFSGTPKNSDVGSVEVKVTAADDDGAEVSDEFVVTVENVNDPPTVANEIADQTATVGKRFRFAFPEDTFADVDAGDSLSYDATLEDGSPLPDWLSFDNRRRRFQGTPGSEDVGSLNVKVEVTDTEGAKVSDVFALTASSAAEFVDLRGQSFTVIPGVLGAGDNLNVVFAVRNVEAEDAGEFEVEFYLSEDETITKSDRLLQGFDISALAGNDIATNFVSLQLPEAGDEFWKGDGSYFVGMVVDADGAIAESNEDNNASLAAGTDYASIEVNNTEAPPANTPPTLTEVSTLTGATVEEAFTISYEDLLAASNAADAEGDPISFRIEESLSGTLTKDGETVAPGETVLAEGEEIVWIPGEVGNAVEALSVKAFDGEDYSAAAVEVAVAVAADNTPPTLTEVSTLTGATVEEAFTITYDNLLAASNAADADGDTLTFRIEESLSGTLTKDGETVAPGETVLAAGEEIVWIPGEVGDGVKALAVKAFDGKEYSDVAVEVEVEVKKNPADLPKVSLAATDAKASEDGGAGQLVVERTGDTSLPLVVNYSIAGNATNGSDYQNLSGIVTIDANATHGTIPIIPIRDYDTEGEETIEITLTAGDYQPEADKTATVTLTDITATSSEGPFVHINPDSGHQYLFAERDSWLGAQEQAEALGGNLVTINDAAEQDWLLETFATDSYLIGLNDSPIYGNQEGEHRWVSGEAVSYTSWESDEPNNHPMFPEGENVVEIRESGEWNDIPTNPESLGRENRYGIIEIDPATQGEPIVNVTVIDSKAGEDGNVGQILFTRVGKLDEDLTLNYNVAGDATNGSDYRELSGSVTIPAGETLVKLPIIALSDDNIESDETVAIELTAGDYQIGSKPRGQVTVVDGPPVNNVVYTNPDTGNEYVLSAEDTWSGAQEQAEILGGNLVTINDASEQKWLQETFAGKDYWIGLNDSPIYGNKEGQYGWVSGEDFDYANWRAEGTDNKTHNPEGEDFAEIELNGAWNDSPNDLEAVKDLELPPGIGIIEIPAATPPNNPPTLTEVSTLTGATQSQPYTITYNNLLAASDAADADGDPIAFEIEDISSGTLTKEGKPIAIGETTLAEGEQLVWTPDIVGDAVKALSVKASDGKESSDSVVEVAVAVAPPAPFSELDANLAGVRYGVTEWADYDSDGDLDILITGDDGNGLGVSKIYRNDSGSFTDIEANIVGVGDGSAAAWGDYDNDGDLDLIIAGETGVANVTKLYTNNDGNFIEVEIDLPQIDDAAVAWGDYDNDGDLDFALSGTDGSINLSQIYQNQNGNFVEIETDIRSVAVGPQLAWGDYDGDGDLDLLLTGGTDIFSGFAEIYRNDGGNFVDIKAGLTGVTVSSADWGDYDSDGDLDILITGASPFFGSSTVYRNDGGNFVDIKAGLTGLLGGSANWGDYDNDGALDILITGNDGFTGATKLYKNNSGSFVEVETKMAGLLNGKASWGDYDSDGDLDILLTGYEGNEVYSKVYTNNLAPAPNTAPTSPTGLTALVDDKDATFSWNSATDAETPTPGLNYNLRVGTTPGGSEVVSPMSLSGGDRLLPAKGNVDGNTSWIVKDLEPDTYYWSVQAVDAAFTGSEFATEGTFVVAEEPVSQKVTVTVHRVREIDNMDLDLFGNNDADFFTKLGINGIEWESDSIRNENDTSPNWQFSQDVTGTTVPITIEINEENSGFFEMIDLVDINPLSGNKTLNLTYNLETGTISGPGVSGRAGEAINLRGAGDDLRAEIWFSVDAEPTTA